MAIETSRKDPNYVSTLMGADLSTGLLPTKVYVDEATHRLLVNAVIIGGVSIAQPSVPVVTVVGDTTSSTSLIAANTSRKEVEFYNNSAAILYLLKGTGTASTANYTVQLNQGDYYSSNITSAFQGIWASDAGGSVLITESS